MFLSIRFSIYSMLKIKRIKIDTENILIKSILNKSSSILNKYIKYARIPLILLWSKKWTYIFFIFRSFLSA